MWTKGVLETGMSTEMGFAYVKGEVRELLEARTLNEVYSEWNDVIACSLLAITNMTGINLPFFPMFGKKSVLAWFERLKVWEDIFVLHVMELHPEYLNSGSNYKKKWKIEKALESAGFDGTIQWENTLLIVGNWEEK